MKRKGHIYANIYSMDNLMLADKIARKNKSGQYGVKAFDKAPEANLALLQQMLISKTYRTGPYNNFWVRDPKLREISALDYFPHRIVHHAIMLQIEETLVNCFTADTYSCIKGRGIHLCLRKLKRALKDKNNTGYYLQIDVKQFYPSVDHKILKAMLRRKFKDEDLLQLLDEIIDSAPGVPIGNYLSQYFANFYLSGLDHYIKEVLQVKHYFRYADDMVFLGTTKDELHRILWQITAYLNNNLNLKVKGNYKVKPVADHGINFLGYIIRHDHTLLRPKLKKSWARAVAKNKNRQSIASYQGWAKWANCKHLTKKLAKPKPDLSHDIIQRAGGNIKEPHRQKNREN